MYSSVRVERSIVVRPYYVGNNVRGSKYASLDAASPPY
jgi:hypothetical protein